ncbi:MAG: hypothetical protein HPZ91_19155 [Lentisphaeria bacterium]|nr:hypothetical protein [Lentisphaeria bacterium]
MDTFNNIWEYHCAIKKLFDKDSEEFFPNSNAEHASAILTEIFRHAKGEVLVFCHDLSESAWESECLRKAIFTAHANHVTIQTAVQVAEPDVKSQKTLAFFRELEIPIFFNRDRDFSFNFIVADRKMFRFEQDYNVCSAIACANNREVGDQLSDLFKTHIAPENIA